MAAQQQPNPVVPVNPIPPVFSRYPAAFNAGILDYAQEADRKIFRNAVKGMDTPYDLKTGSLRVFLETVKEHAAIHGLGHNILVPVNGVNINLLDSYGLVSMEDCMAHAQTYVAAENRQDQNSVILYHYLSASLTDVAKGEVLASPQAYQVTTVNAAGVATVHNMVGVTFLKAIIQRACVDTIATVTSIREAVSLLDHKMEETGSDIKAFNEYVQGLVNMLRARGEGTPEFITHMFKGYAAASDSDFVQYMKEKRNRYEEGQPLDIDTLMQSALNKYNIAIQTGRWNAPDKKDATIFAMKTEIEALKKKATAPGTTGSGNAGKWAWKSKKPEAGTPKSKVVNKKKYHWCPNHEMWTLHSPEECKGTNFRNKGNTKPNDATTDGDRTISLAQGLRATVEFEEEGGYDE
jgi:hypothetical protein